MMQKLIFQLFLLVLSFSLICPAGNTIPPTIANLGVKVAVPRTKHRAFIRAYNDQSSDAGIPVSSLSQKKRIEALFENNLVQPKQVTPQQVKPSNMYQHQLEGEWDYAIGHFGFFHEFPKTGTVFVSIIGVRTKPEGNGTYTTDEWDRKAFWFDVGDGIPMHLSAEYFTEFTDEADESLSVLVYHSSNLLFRQNGKDYSQTQLKGEWINFELLTDVNNIILDYNIILLDENDEEVNVRKFEPGDQVESWTTVYILEDPDSIWLTSMEEDFRTVINEPIFMYEHMTPNVDFPNKITKDLIDFPIVDLKLTLLGVSFDKNAKRNYLFSAVKDIGVKWNGSVSTGVMDWFLSFF